MLWKLFFEVFKNNVFFFLLVMVDDTRLGKSIVILAPNHWYIKNSTTTYKLALILYEAKEKCIYLHYIEITGKSELTFNLGMFKSLDKIQGCSKLFENPNTEWYFSLILSNWCRRISWHEIGDQDSNILNKYFNENNNKLNHTCDHLCKRNWYKLNQLTLKFKWIKVIVVPKEHPSNWLYIWRVIKCSLLFAYFTHNKRSKNHQVNFSKVQKYGKWENKDLSSLWSKLKYYVNIT